MVLVSHAIMQVVTWSAWLDHHIPYYQKHKQIQRYADTPPACVLIVTPVDRNRRATHDTFTWTRWDDMDNRINELGYRVSPLFLDTDTHQRWYWAFWSQDEALMAVIRLS